MLAVQGYDPFIIGLDITALIDLSSWYGGALWWLAVLCRALQTARAPAG